MTLEWYSYLLGIGGAIVGGIFIASCWYLIYHYKLKRDIKKLGLPKDKAELKNWLEQNKDLTKDAGKTTDMDKKEVEEDDARRISKYREYEKLRNLAATSAVFGMEIGTTQRSELPRSDAASTEQDKRIVELD